MRAPATYHCSISTLRTKGACVCCSTSGESIREEDQADTIDPSEIKDQRPEETNCEVVHDHVYAEPQSEHLNVSHCVHIMLLLRKHSCDAAGLWIVIPRSVWPDLGVLRALEYVWRVILPKYVSRLKIWSKGGNLDREIAYLGQQGSRL